jgi:hypothetical protein
MGRGEDVVCIQTHTKSHHPIACKYSILCDFLYEELDGESLRSMQLKFENLNFLLPNSGHRFGTASEHMGLKAQILRSISAAQAMLTINFVV